MNVGCECASDMNHVGVKVKSGGEGVAMSVLELNVRVNE